MAALTPEKLNELMLKARKGAISSFQIPHYLAIFEALGGSTETFTFLEPFTKEVQVPEADMKRWQREYQADLVSAPPQKPKNGKRYVLEIKRQEEVLNRYTGESSPGMVVRGFFGRMGFRFKTPEGKTVELTESPSYGGVTRRDVAKFMESIDWVERINQFLQMKAHVPASARTSDGTGTCPVCFHNVKMSSSGKIVLHGYERPGQGYIHGKCFGVGFPPYEVSVDGVAAYLSQITDEVVALKRELRDLKSGKIDSIPIFNSQGNIVKVYTKDDPNWAMVIKSQLPEIEQKLQSYEELQSSFNKLKAHWVARSLPVEGEAHKEWFFAGQRSAALASRVAARYLNQAYRV